MASVFDRQNPTVSGLLTVERLRVKKRKLDLPNNSVASFAVDTSDGHLVDTTSAQDISGTKTVHNFVFVDDLNEITYPYQTLLDKLAAPAGGDVFLNETNIFSGHNEFSDFQLNDTEAGTTATLEQIVALTNDGATLSTNQTLTGTKTFTDLNLNYGEGNTITHQQLVDAALGGGAGGGDVYLANNQTFTGENIFKSIILQNDVAETQTTSNDIISATNNFNGIYNGYVKPVSQSYFALGSNDYVNWLDVRGTMQKTDYILNYLFGATAYNKIHLDAYSFENLAAYGINSKYVFSPEEANPILLWKDYGRNKLKNYLVFAPLENAVGGFNRWGMRVVLLYDDNTYAVGNFDGQRTLVEKITRRYIATVSDTANYTDISTGRLQLNILAAKGSAVQYEVPLSTVNEPGLLHGILPTGNTSFPALVATDDGSTWDDVIAAQCGLTVVYNPLAVDANKITTVSCKGNELYFNAVLQYTGSNTLSFNPPQMRTIVNLRLFENMNRVDVDGVVIDTSTDSLFTSGYVLIDAQKTSLSVHALPSGVTLVTAFIYTYFDKTNGFDSNNILTYLYIAVKDSANVIHVQNRNIEFISDIQNRQFWSDDGLNVAHTFKVRDANVDNLYFDTCVPLILCDVDLPIMVFGNHFDSSAIDSTVDITSF